MEIAKREEQIFVSRDLWVPDQNSKSCFNCNAKFLPPFKRRHHCRMCGKVFCGKCTNNFLHPPEFKFENEKEIRVCDHCFKLSQNIIKKLNHSEILVNFRSSARKKSSRKFTSPMESFNHALKESPLFSMNVVLSYHLSGIIDGVAERSFKEAGVTPYWNDLLKDFVMRALHDVQPDTVDGTDCMDITKYIKIKKIPYKDASETKYIEGIVIRKNLTHKRMSNEIFNPRILMISGSLDCKDNQGLTNLGSLIAEEKDQAKHIVKNILKVQPDIVIVEKTVNWGIQELLRQDGVTLIFKLRPNQFGRICRATGAKFIDDLKFLNEDPDKYIGTCALFKVMNLNNYEHFERAHNHDKKAHFDPSIMKFDGCNHSKGITILISEKDLGELQAVKGCLFKCFRMLRNSVIEKEVILQEIFLYYTKDEVSRALSQIQFQNQSKIKAAEELLVVEEEYIDDSQLSYKQYFGYNQTGSKGMKFSNFHLLNEETIRSAGFLLDFQDESYFQKDRDHPDIKAAKFTKVNLVILSQEGDFEGLRNEELSELEARLIVNEDKKLDHLAQICSTPKPKINEFYSRDDTSFGDFIKKKAELLFTKCEDCNRPRYHHTAFFYKNDSYVKVSTEATGPLKQTMKRELQKFRGKKSEVTGVRSNNRQKTAFPTNDSDLHQSGRKLTEENKNEGSFSKIFRPLGKIFGDSEISNGRREPVSPKIKKDACVVEEINSINLDRYNSNSTTNSQSPSHRDLTKKTKINMYLECNSCHKKVSDEFELSRVYLEYSLTKFLGQLVSSHEKKEFSQPSCAFSLDSPTLFGPATTLASIENDSPASPKAQFANQFHQCCRYSSKSRVFKYQEFLIKFTTGTNKVYSELEINHTNDIVQASIERANVEQLKLRSQSYIFLFHSLLDFVLPYLKAPIDFLIQKSKLDVNESHINLMAESLAKESSSSPDGNLFLLKELLIVKQKLLQIREKIHEEFSFCNTYLNVEETRKIFFFQIADLCKRIHKAREEFLSPPKCENNTGEDPKDSLSGRRASPKRKKQEQLPKKSDASIENMNESIRSSKASKSSKSSILSVDKAKNLNLGKMDSSIEKSDCNTMAMSSLAQGVMGEDIRRSTEHVTENILSYFRKPCDRGTGQDFFELEFADENTATRMPVNLESSDDKMIESRGNSKSIPKIQTNRKSIALENDGANTKYMLSLGSSFRMNSSYNSRSNSEWTSVIEKNEYSSTSTKKSVSAQTKKVKDAEDEKESEMIRKLTNGLGCPEYEDESEQYQIFVTN